MGDVSILSDARGRCRSCGAPIEWVFMRDTGKRCPVDAGTIEKRLVLSGDPRGLDGVEAAVRWTAVSHFATCPHADRHRRGGDRG